MHIGLVIKTRAPPMGAGHFDFFVSDIKLQAIY
jgi:hypothetical protein